jgi:hypothetical protein
MVNVMGALWTTMNGPTNLLGGILVDIVGRRRQISMYAIQASESIANVAIHIVIGYICCTITLIILCVLTLEYSGTGNKAGNSAAAAFTFVLILSYGLGTECPSFIYATELFPSDWRAEGVSFSTIAVPLWSILFTSVASPAFAHIGAKYYIVFASLSAVMVFVVYFLFPEVS